MAGTTAIGVIATGIGITGIAIIGIIATGTTVIGEPEVHLDALKNPAISGGVFVSRKGCAIRSGGNVRSTT